MVRFYLMPQIVRTVIHPISGKTLTTKVPKYAADLGTIERKMMLPYGLQPVYLIAADVTPAQHAVLAGYADNSFFPPDIDQAAGANLATVQAELESHDIPAEWVTAGTIYRTILRLINGVCLIGQVFTRKDAEMNGGDGNLLPAGVTMATAYSAMPLGYRTALLAAVDELGYNRTSLGASSTLRDLLRVVGSQAAPNDFLGVVI